MRLRASGRQVERMVSRPIDRGELCLFAYTEPVRPAAEDKQPPDRAIIAMMTVLKIAQQAVRLAGYDPPCGPKSRIVHGILDKVAQRPADHLLVRGPEPHPVRPLGDFGR